MSTGIRSLTGRPQAAWRPWLLALVVVGIVGMHGLVLGAGTTATHHVPASAPATAPAGHAAVDHTAHHVGPTTPADPLSSTTVQDHGDQTSGSAVALCVALLLSLVVGVAFVRRTTWSSALDRSAPRLVLPSAPLLRDRTPVPRFTVMRC